MKFNEMEIIDVLCPIPYDTYDGVMGEGMVKYTKKIDYPKLSFKMKQILT
jgi:hypothetical protein